MTALQTYSGEFRVFDGTLNVTTGYGVRFYVVSEIGCDVNIDMFTGIYTIASVLDDNASAIFVAKYNGISLYKTFTVAKSRELNGPGSAKRIILDTINHDFAFDQQNQPATETTILTVNKYNTTAPTTWRLKKLDETIIAEGTGASLVAGGFATSSPNGDHITIDQTVFNNVINTNGTNAIIVEVEVIDGTAVFLDRTTLFKLVQVNKVTFEGISDPTGAKAQLIQTSYDANFVSNQLQRTVDDITTRTVQTAASLHTNVRRVERLTNQQFVVEKIAREELGVALGNVSANLVTEQSVRASADAALSTSLTELTADVGDVNAALNNEQIARVVGDTALSASIVDLTADVGDVNAALTSEQSARASADTALSNSFATLSATVSGVRADLTTEATARANADGALTSLYNNLNASLGTTNANLTTEATARANADTALSSTISTLTTTVGGISADLTTEATARSDADSALTSLYNSLNASLGTTNANVTAETNARVGADNALTSSLSTLTARLNLFNGTGGTVEAFAGSITSAVSSEAATRASQDTALQADYDGKIGTINSSLSTQVSKLGVVENRWTLSLNAGGNAVAGLVLANGSNSQSIFAAQADKFFIFDSSGSGTSPFYVSGGQTYIQNATIANAAITEARIADLAVGNGKIGNLAVTTLKIDNNAVTIPVSAYTDGDVSIAANSWTTVQQVTITSSGAQITVGGFCVLRTPGGTFENLFTQYRVLRDGNDIFNASGTALRYSTGDVSAMPVGFMITDTPGSGSHTYTFQYLTPRSGYAQRRSLVLIETKK